ncbi:MAG: hypothetical protein A2Y70_08855 [Candidatus Aminicenantes bacterium RBG_13_64_14]|nr:MAG: hypothetical protein A2Y70_08855 [Candidatus Aminicenantes bacterium RBG_13_64_14]
MRDPIEFRAAVIFLMLVFSIVVLGPGQTRVDNPGRALAKNAGRVVKLEEVLRIRDDGTNAVFRLPRKLALGADGSLFFHDFAEGDRLYRYSPEGKLRYKILKTGQGPGESQHVSNFFLEGDRIRVQAWTPPKIMDFGLDGRYLSEIPTESTHGLHSLFKAGGKIYGLRDEIPHSQAIFKTGLIETPYSLYEISPDFKTWRKLQDFPVRHSIKNHSWVRLDMIDAAAGGPFVYVVHTAGYGIEQFDLRTGRIERVIRRTYRQPRSEPSKDEDLDPEAKGIVLPSDIPSFDILEIHVVRDRLWAFTSTRKANGDEWLVDVFDAEGQFIDSFYLEFPDDKRHHFYSKGLITDDGYLFVPEQEEDGLVSIGKYRIVDADLFPPGSAHGDIRAARRGQ